MMLQVGVHPSDGCEQQDCMAVTDGDRWMTNGDR